MLAPLQPHMLDALPLEPFPFKKSMAAAEAAV